jgi:hypothetical protein
MYVSADAASMYLVVYFWNSAGSHTCSLDGIMGVIALSGIWGNEEGADIAACREKVVALVKGKRWYVPYHSVGVLVWVVFRRIVASALMSARLSVGNDMGKCLRDKKLTCHMRILCCSKRICGMFTSADSYIVRHQVEACKAMYAAPASCNPTYRNQR